MNGKTIVRKHMNLADVVEAVAKVSKNGHLPKGKNYLDMGDWLEEGDYLGAKIGDLARDWDEMLDYAKANMVEETEEEWDEEQYY